MVKYNLAIITVLVYIITMATTVRFTVQLDAELCAWLDAEARIQNRSRNKQLAAILQALKNQAKIRHNMLDERWLDLKSQLDRDDVPYGDRIG